MISSMNRDKQERLAIERRQGNGLGVDDLDRARPMAQAADMAALLQSIDQPKDAGTGLKTKPIAYLGERWGDAARCLLIGVDISEGFKLARGHSTALDERKGAVSREERKSVAVGKRGSVR